ncbi:RNB domain-containing ribonuclease [Deinococcus radiopugnans]|uniref:Exoribonuclease-2 n=1 Tax=Deinococcus radiopugnans ATCC 19172 TaxID=585398 RepID=A0A5C4Y3M0_9DEIO|nr:RNB domain-containing ribonuclease [Deinococcus radiopugnans]MBB6017338.1 exoribonuclease-2 [Deinococcus radiopugnans ATCC 19172]TNM70090.1 RNB domain-containing ribonuclease [Deinococcus radiopugnans ATCC 19172]
MTLPELTPAQRTEVELLARGKAEKSRTLRDLKLPETPESAHTLLLRLGVWNEARTPYADRLGASLTHLTLDVPDFAPEQRLDLSHLPAYAIDDEGNRDPDDAIGIEALPGGLTRLWVHVSDVAALVPPDSELDLEARARGATLYLPDQTIGMLPDALVEKTGLGLHETMPALSISLDLDADGNADAVDVALTTVRITRLTYLGAQARLEAGEEPFVTLARLARASKELRDSEGALSIDLPEVKIRADEHGATVTPLPKPEMRFVVQECMTLAGWAAAIYADDHDIPLPFATQADPSREVRGDGLGAQWARRKTLARTRFQPSPGPHSGMGLDLYAQATSPMRRYLDLVVHQQLRAALTGREPLDGKVVAAHIAQATLNADATRQAERLSRKHHTLRYAATQPEREWEAVVVDRRGPQATLLIPELAYDLPLSTPAPVGTVLKVRLVDVNLPALSMRARTV